MRNIKRYTYVLAKFLVIFAVRADDFEYGNQASWYDKYEQCSLHRQSPIELNSKDAVLSYDIPAISFEHYGTPYSTAVKTENNGHTANILLPKPIGYIPSLWEIYDRLSPHIAGGSLPTGKFIAESLHFHWGSKDSHGSEHVIDSERYSMEMHILHRNSKYRTVEEARTHVDGLAVLAVLFSVKPSFTDFSGLEIIINALEAIGEFNKTTEINNFNLAGLITGLDLAEFYSYEGSLTTPPCSQAVTWIVFSHVIPISHAQMNRFHKLSDGHGARLENNYRALQAKGNRRVVLRNKRKVIDSVIQSPIFMDAARKLRAEALKASAGQDLVG